MRLDSELRDLIRRAIDARVRELRADDRHDRFTCSECGGDKFSVTEGCHLCVDRARRRLRRQNEPGFRERETLKSTESRRRRRERERASS